MPELRIALAQVDATVGDLDGNAELIIEWTRRAAEQNAQLVVFPEMMLTGYPVEDLALRASFVQASVTAIGDVASRLGAEGLGGIAVVAGYLDRRADLARRTGLPAGAPLDAAALLYDGRVVITSAKHHLPNYGVFDEYRYFVPGSTLPVFRMQAGGGPVDIAIAICEDLWQDGGPVAVTHRAGAGLLAVPNASPYERGKDDVRLDLCVRRAREAGAALAYANLIGGQDELVFDGDSILVSASGELLARGPQFEEALVVADLTLPPAAADGAGDGAAVDAGDGTQITVRRVTLPPVPRPAAAAAGTARSFWPRLDDLAEVYAALVTGTRDYVRKNGFRTVVLGLSGGIDSALTATIAADAIGPRNVHAVLLPSRFSSDHSVSDAEELVRRQGLQSSTVPIASIVEALNEAMAPAGYKESGLPGENLQARIRGMIWMALSNSGVGDIALTAGNKSELATGYSTLYGDSAGGFGPIKDVPKTLVWQLARWRNEQAERQGRTPPIPRNSIDKPPSAELAPGQLDTDSLPPYEVLDALLDDYVEKDKGAAELIAAGHDPELVQRVIRLVDTAEYKRRQYPPGPKISPKNFGRDRRLPITDRWREPAPQSLTGENRRVRSEVIGDIGYRRFVPAEASLLAEFLTTEDWPYHGAGAPGAAGIRRQAAAGDYDNDRTRAFWVVAGGTEAGLIRLLDLGDDTPLFDLRIRAAYRGQGLGTSALRWLTGYLFTEFPGIRRIEGTTRQDNHAMRRTFRTCGYVKEAHYRQAWPAAGGAVYDAVGYAIVRTDWQAGTITPPEWDDEPPATRCGR